jgi:glutamate-1-semialdehyde 2,1-aminomutase
MAQKPGNRTVRRSKRAFQDACQLFPGGVNSPVRSWKSLGLNEEGPFFVQRASGAELIDLDGNRYLDFVGSWGPMILGHADTAVVSAVRKWAYKGLSYGAPTEHETRLAKKIQTVFPSLERMRFVSSGTEAVMHAVRVARGFTGRDKIIKFEGHFHGASDGMLVKAGSGAATLGVPDSAGVPAQIAALTLLAPFNDADAVKALRFSGTPAHAGR